MDDDLDFQRARRRVHQLKGFYIHMTVFVGIMLMLLVINLVTSPGVWWVQWAFLGWGVGVIAHTLVVFGLAGWLGPEWEERKIRELMGKR